MQISTGKFFSTGCSFETGFYGLITINSQCYFHLLLHFNKCPFVGFRRKICHCSLQVDAQLEKETAASCEPINMLQCLEAAKAELELVRERERRLEAERGVRELEQALAEQSAKRSVRYIFVKCIYHIPLLNL